MVTTIPKPQSGGSEKTLLWTNSNPTASFSAQTISVDLSSYSEIEIEFKHAATASSKSYLFQKARVPSNDLCLFYLNAKSTTAEIESREITVTTTGITFGEGKRAQGAFTTGTDNIRCVPIEIYGIN